MPISRWRRSLRSRESFFGLGLLDTPKPVAHRVEQSTQGTFGRQVGLLVSFFSNECGPFQLASRTANGSDNGRRKFPFLGKVRRGKTKKEVYKITENTKRPMRVFLL